MEQPEIEPNYFDWDIGEPFGSQRHSNDIDKYVAVEDMEMTVQTVKFVKSLNQVEPWKSDDNRELDPGPECKTDEQIRGSFQPTYSSLHPH